MPDNWQRGQYGGGGGGRHTTAAICSNGHVVTADVERFGEKVGKFCSKCGSEVATTYGECGERIPGHYVPPGVPGVEGNLKTPAYCHACGKPYPWTAKKIGEAKDLADELEDLSADDRAKLKAALDDVTGSGPKAEASAARIKKWLGKATSALGQAVWKASVEIGSEAAKKYCWDSESLVET
jgi:hypothetical protein